MPIPLNPIENSSNIDASGYDGQTSTLRVRFKNGASYDYHGVTPELAQAFQESPSPGKFVATILKPSCPAERVKEESDEQSG